MGIIIFVTIAEGIVILAHLFLFYFWVYFFRITNPMQLRILGITLFILSISFLGASLLVFWRDNILSKFLYYIAAIWLGLLLYLFLATIAIWVIIPIFKLTGAEAIVGVAALALIISALLYSAYGFWNAANPMVRNIEVTIPNLPASWKGRTAVQISDIHLGTIWGRRFMEHITRKIALIKPDIVFITGDLFDGEGDDLTGEAEPLSALSPPLGMYFITGNHETYLGIDKTSRALSALPITWLHDKMIIVDGVQLLGIDYPLRGEHKDLSLLLKNLNPGQPNIVLFHSPIHLDIFKKSGVNLQLAGHTHQGQIWPLNYITNKVYNGYDRGLHEEGSYTLYTSVGTGTWGPPMRTGNNPEIVVIKFN